MRVGVMFDPKPGKGEVDVRNHPHSQGEPCARSGPADAVNKAHNKIAKDHVPQRVQRLVPQQASQNRDLLHET